jgi:Amt family ammonium transporter
VAWVGALVLGPRRFRFDDNRQPMPSFNIGYSVLGVMMLWFGWWGFNGGSLSKFGDVDFFGKVASVIQNTNLAGAAAGLSAYLFAVLTGRQAVYEKLIGGTLGGLVAITASCDTVHPLGALAIGAAAGIVHNLAFDWLRSAKNPLRVDDVAGAVPVHLFCGIFGTLCAVVGTGRPWQQQAVVQLYGIGCAMVWAVGSSFLVFWLLERIAGLRSSIFEEDHGDAAA